MRALSCNPSREVQIRRRVASTISEGMIRLAATQVLEHPEQDSVVFFHAVGVPPSVRFLHVALWPNFVPQARAKELIAGIDEVGPDGDALLHTQTRRQGRRHV